MAALVGRRVRVTQPQQNPQIDWSNPITAGLVFAYTMSNEAQGWGEDGRNGIPYVKTSDGTPFGKAVNTLMGTGGQLLSGAGYLFGAPAQTSIKSGVYSMFAFGTGPASGIQSALDDDDGTTRRFQFRINAGKIELNPFYSGGNGNVISPVALSAADLVGGFAMGATVNGTAYAIFQKGVKTTGTPMASTALTPNTSISVGARKTGTQGWLSGGLQLVAMWNRALTDAEQSSLADNPWQLFKVQPARRLWLAWSAGADGTATVTGVAAATGTGIVAAAGDASSALTGVSAATNTGAVTAQGGATASPAGVSSSTGVGTMGAAGGAGASFAGVSASTSTGTMTSSGDASTAVSGLQVLCAVGTVTASAGGSGTATVTGVSVAAGTGALIVNADALATVSGVSCASAVGVVSGVGSAAIAITSAQATCAVGTLSATGTSGDVVAYIQGIAAATSVGNMTATGTRTTIEVNVTEDMICRVVRSYIKSIATSLPVLRTPVNRAAMPKGPYVSFTPGLRRPLSTNRDSNDANSRTVSRSEQMSFQIDCYGAGAADLAETLNALYRDTYACELFANSGLEIVPLYAGDIQQAPFVNDADQYEDRYTFEIELQVNPSIVVPLQSCNILDINLVSVDATFPPT